VNLNWNKRWKGIEFILLILFNITIGLYTLNSLNFRVKENILSQNLIRQPISDGRFIYFSTLESYNTENFKENNTQLIKYDLFQSKVDTILKVKGSSEVRSIILNNDGGLVLGTSLTPSLYSLNSSTNRLNKIYSSQKGMWYHQITQYKDTIYLSLSEPHPHSNENFKILKIPIEGGKTEEINISMKRIQGYSGIQTINPKGEIFFWTAYPFKLFKYNPWTKNLKERAFYNNNIRNTILTWDTINKQSIDVIVKSDDNGKTLDFQSSLPEGLIKVDLFHTNHSLRNIYISKHGVLFRREGSNFEQIYGIKFENVNIWPNIKKHFEYPLLVSFKDKKNLQILSVNEENLVLLHQPETKNFYQINPKIGEIQEINLNYITNLSKSELTSISAPIDSILYLSGYLTTLSIAELNTHTNKLKLWETTIKGRTGQVSAILKLNDSTLISGGYPKSIIFKTNLNNNSDTISHKLLFEEKTEGIQERVLAIIPYTFDSFITVSNSDYSEITRSQLKLMNQNGKILKLKEFDFRIEEVSDISDNKNFLISDGKENILLLDENFKLLSKIDNQGLNLRIVRGKSSTFYLTSQKSLFKLNNMELHKTKEFIMPIERAFLIESKNLIVLRNKYSWFTLNLTSEKSNLKLRPIDEWLFSRDNWNRFEYSMSDTIYYTNLHRLKSFSLDQF